MPTTVCVRELKNQTSRIIRAVREDLSEYVGTLRGEPVAVLRPLAGGEAQRLRQVEIDAALAEIRALAQEVAAAGHRRRVAWNLSLSSAGSSWL